MDKATLNLWNESKHNYVLARTRPTGYGDERRAGRPGAYAAHGFLP